jgi:hypothetical protein
MNDPFQVIIEHPRRGTLRDLELDIDHQEKARFSTSGSRNDPKKTKQFSSLREAFATLQKIPTPTRYECNILVYNPVEIAYYKLVKI